MVLEVVRELSPVLPTPLKRERGHKVTGRFCGSAQGLQGTRLEADTFDYFNVYVPSLE